MMQVYLVEIIDEEEVITLRIYHFVFIKHQALQVDLLDLLFNVLVIEHSGYVDQVGAERVDVENDTASALM